MRRFDLLDPALDDGADLRSLSNRRRGVPPVAEVVLLTLVTLATTALVVEACQDDHVEGTASEASLTK